VAGFVFAKAVVQQQPSAALDLIAEKALPLFFFPPFPPFFKFPPFF
jgi:hypothetical protein